MANGRATRGARWLLASSIVLVAGVGASFAADLEAAWDAQLRGRLLLAQVLLESDGPATPAHRLALAGVALELGDLDRAQSALGSLTADKGHPDYPYAALLLGRLHLAVGRDDAARSAFVASLEQSAHGPYAAAAHLALIRLDLHEGAFDHAGERLSSLADLGRSPELAIAVELLDPDGSDGLVRSFSSPLGLFAAARLSEGVVSPPLAAHLPLVESRAEPLQLSDSRGGRWGAGLQPIIQSGIAQMPTAGSKIIADTVREQPSAMHTRIGRGLVAVSSDAGYGGPWFSLRIGLFRELTNAQHKVKVLEEDGYPARTQVDGSFHEVLVDAIFTLKAAELLLKQLQDTGYDGEIIPYSADADQ